MGGGACRPATAWRASHSRRLLRVAADSAGDGDPRWEAHRMDVGGPLRDRDSSENVT